MKGSLKPARSFDPVLADPLLTVGESGDIVHNRVAMLRAERRISQGDNEPTSPVND